MPVYLNDKAQLASHTSAVLGNNTFIVKARGVQRLMFLFPDS